LPAPDVTTSTKKRPANAKRMTTGAAAITGAARPVVLVISGHA
jgi:hypothetical protein